jgi:hypothetical protein
MATNERTSRGSPLRHEKGQASGSVAKRRLQCRMFDDGLHLN